MKRIAIALVIAIVALASIIVARTLSVPAYIPATAVPPPITFDGNQIAARLSEAIKLRTISWQPGAPAGDIAASQKAFVDFHAWIDTTYPEFAKSASRENIGEYTLLFTWKGSDPSLKPILLMSHMDVVPVAPGTEGNWTHPPFAGDIADGYIWGRGTMDVKNGVIGLLEAAEALIKSGHRPKRTIMFSFGHDEELGGTNGNKLVAELLKQRKIELEFVVDEGGAVTLGVLPGVAAPVALIGIAEKGYVTLELKARSAGGHSSLPLPVHQTAIGRLARAIDRLDQAPFEGRIDGIARDMMEQVMPAMPFMRRLAVANLWLFESYVVKAIASTPAGGASLRTTIAPTIISGGIKENVLPPEATALVNFRIHPRDSVQGVIDHVTKVIDDKDITVTVKGLGREPSPTSNAKGPQFALIKSVIAKLVPGVISAPNLVSGGTDSKYFVEMTNNVFRFTPAVLSPEELKGFHGTDERMPVESLALIATFFHDLIKAADEPMQAPSP